MGTSLRTRVSVPHLWPLSIQHRSGTEEILCVCLLSTSAGIKPSMDFVPGRAANCSNLPTPRPAGWREACWEKVVETASTQHSVLLCSSPGCQDDGKSASHPGNHKSSGRCSGFSLKGLLKGRDRPIKAMWRKHRALRDRSFQRRKRTLVASLALVHSPSRSRS